MAKVKCSKLNKELDGLDRPPFSGELGQLIWNNVSKEAWNEWLNVQLMIINEYKLDLAEEKDRSLLESQMKVFLGLSEDDGMQLLTLSNT